MARSLVNRARFFVNAVRLAEDDPAPDAPKTPRYKWVHAASGGHYEGHYSGPFDLTREVFESMVRNFRADPKYKRGELDLGDGPVEVGIKPVIQFDYEHASEMPPYEGSIAQSGAPACAWALDVEVREAADGTPHLWALADLGEQLRGQIDRGEYHSLSIAWTPDGVHWQSGESIGPVLTSIAVTNHPFLRDLESIAASARASAAAGQRTGSAIQPTSPEAGGTTPKGTDMSDALRKRLTSALKIRLQADDEAIGAAVEEATASSATLADLLSLLGVQDGASAMEIIPQLRSAQQQLTALQAELSALLQADAAVDAQMAESDVAAALKAQKLPESVGPAIAAFREQCINQEIDKLKQALKKGEHLSVGKVREARAAGRRAFLEAYKVDASSTELSSTSHLTTSLVAGPGGQQLSTGGRPGATPGVRPVTIEDRNDGDGGETVDLSQYSGSTTNRIVQHLRATEQGFDKLSWEKQIERARLFRRTHQVQVAS